MTLQGQDNDKGKTTTRARARQRQRQGQGQHLQQRQGQHQPQGQLPHPSQRKARMGHPQVSRRDRQVRGRLMNANGAMDQERCAEIFERVRRAAGGTDVEVTVQGGRSALTRFANNSITQNVSEEGCEVSVRVQMGGRTARATTNRLDEESLRRVVGQAEALARVQEEDSELLPMLTAAEQGSAVEL